LPYQNNEWIKTPKPQQYPQQVNSRNNRYYPPNTPNSGGFDQVWEMMNKMGDPNGGFYGNNGVDFMNMLNMMQKNGYSPNNMMNPFGNQFSGGNIMGPLKMLGAMNRGRTPMGTLFNLGRLFFW
jgi:hypothetical protein